MLAVLDASDSLTAVLSAAATTTNPTYSVRYRDADSGELNDDTGLLTDDTAVTIVAAPNRRRHVEGVYVHNSDTAAATVTVSKVVSGTSYPIAAVTVPSGGRLNLDQDGPKVVNSSGESLYTTGDTSGAGVANTDVTAAETVSGIVRKTVLTLTDVSVTVGNTTGVSFGGTKIYDFPAGRILILGVTAANISFDLSDAGNATPIDAADGGDIAIGSTVAGDGTLTGTDVDLLPSTSIDPISDGVDGAALAASAQFDGTTTALDAYFNILIDDADVGDGASDVLLVSGTVTIHWINLGDY